MGKKNILINVFYTTSSVFSRHRKDTPFKVRLSNIKGIRFRVINGILIGLSKH